MPEKTCPVLMHDGKPCGRSANVQVGSQRMCVLHAPIGKKSENTFKAELSRYLDNHNDEVYDFSGFEFPEVNFDKLKFDKLVCFDRAIFCGETRFEGTEFNKGVVFSKAEFKAHAMFRDTIFDYDIDFTNLISSKGTLLRFWKATFKETQVTRFSNTELKGNTEFYQCVFHGSSYFNLAKFYGKLTFWGETVFKMLATFSGAEFRGGLECNCIYFENSVGFPEAMFAKQSEFKDCVFEKGVSFKRAIVLKDGNILFDAQKPDRSRGDTFIEESDFSRMKLYDTDSLTFRKINLDKCRFLETDVTKVEFIDVSWAIRKTNIPEIQFNAVFDEIGSTSDSLKNNFYLIAQLYRQLQYNYESVYDYHLSGDFHIGEQEMKRKNKGPIRQYVCASILYKIVSYYGQSFMLAFLWTLDTEVW